MVADGLVEVTRDEVRVTARGRLLVRPIAMLFDRLLREAAEEKRYSRVI
jgi:oxygen-independent coproporphyrinogen-3 oxidase